MDTDNPTVVRILCRLDLSEAMWYTLSGHAAFLCSFAKASTAGMRRKGTMTGVERPSVFQLLPSSYPAPTQFLPMRRCVQRGRARPRK